MTNPISQNLTATCFESCSNREVNKTLIQKIHCVLSDQLDQDYLNVKNPFYLPDFLRKKISLSNYITRIATLSDVSASTLILATQYLCRQTEQPEKPLVNGRPHLYRTSSIVDTFSQQAQINNEPSLYETTPISIELDEPTQIHEKFIYLARSTIHKLFLTAMLVAIKCNEDTIYSSKTYAHIGGIETNELNYLEGVFFKHCNDKLFVSPSQYFEFETRLNNRAGHQHCQCLTHLTHTQEALWTV